MCNQYQFIAFSIFSCGFLIIYCKILIITVISNETTYELIIYAKLCRNVTLFYQQGIASLLYQEHAGTQNEVFREGVSLQMTVI